VVDLSGLEAWSRAYFPDAPVALAQQGHLEVRAHARGGRLDLERARLSFGAARLALEPASLQSNDQDWLDSTLDVTIKSEQLSLAALTPAVDLPLNGQVEVNGRLRGSLRDLQGELQARIASLVLAEGKVLPVRQLEADVAGSLTLGGPLQSLRWTADLNVRHGSLKVAPQIPVITRISADLEASPASAILKGLEADLGGSALRIKGSLPMPWQHQRAIDLTVAGEDVLLTRANGLRARADVDLHLTGPLDRVHVGGTVLLRDGRFVRHVPLRPFAQHVPSPAATFRPFVIDHGLLQAWTFDVSVRTVEPFSVDNNLARGGVRIDLALAGTGAAPYFTGAVDFSAMRLTLPFTSFDVESGNLRFSERNPYDPDVLLVAHSRRRSIDIDLDVTGTWQEPQVAFASSPPLPSDDVLLLVTTGRLPDEFAGNAGKQGLALAGSFFGRELFAEMFASSSTEAQQDFFDRLAVEVGTETSSSGRENILIEYDLADPWYLQAERDVYNDYNIGVVYRIRFR
ncbi:MAG: translocation/assembly module TamB domain-containing protein, partial [Planctomycetota bacterium]